MIKLTEEQAKALGKDVAMALKVLSDVIYGYYSGLIISGFDKEQALKLTAELQNMLISKAFMKNDDAADIPDLSLMLDKNVD